MHPNPHQVRAFGHVAREGSFSAAANKLGVTQSAVTQHVSNLEREVGSRLLLRSREGVQLTNAGRDLFDLAERFLTLETLIQERVQGYADLSRGHLTIIANAPQPALEIIAGFGQRHPDIEVDFTLYDWTRAMGLLGTNQADIGIITAPSQSEDLYISKITEARYVLYCPTDHALACRDIISLSDLAGEVLLLPERGSLTQRVVSKVLKSQNVNPRRTLKTTTFPVMKEAILQGVGVGIFLEKSATEETRLAEVPILEIPDPFDTCLVVPKHKMELRLLQAFVEVVRDASLEANGRGQSHQCVADV